MKISKYPVKHSYKLARIISDVISFAIAFLIVNATLNFFPAYRRAMILMGNKNVEEIVNEYRYSLTYRQYFAWIFPALVLGIFAAYLILVLKNHKFAKYNITKQNAQSVYDWYAFAVSLCKLPLLLGVFDIMYIFQQRMMFNKVSLFSVQVILDAVIIAIIIRLSVHRIRGLTMETEPIKNESSGGVKAKLADDDDNDEVN